MVHSCEPLIAVFHHQKYSSSPVLCQPIRSSFSQVDFSRKMGRESEVTEHLQLLIYCCRPTRPLFCLFGSPIDSFTCRSTHQIRPCSPLPTNCSYTERWPATGTSYCFSAEGRPGRNTLSANHKVPSNATLAP